jgi:hypothetical protein
MLRVRQEATQARVLPARSLVVLVAEIGFLVLVVVPLNQGEGTGLPAAPDISGRSITLITVVVAAAAILVAAQSAVLAAAAMAATDSPHLGQLAVP